jgi:hypothetical protein
MGCAGLGSRGQQKGRDQTDHQPFIAITANVRNGSNADIERTVTPCQPLCMDQTPTIETARQFLSVVWEGERPTDEALLTALDRLVEAYHHTPDVGPSDGDLEVPRAAGPTLYQELAGRFPDYGYYPVSDPAGSPGSAEAAMVGDAIDDLVDLTLDMREVIWLAEHVGPNDAHWCYRLLYFHWGRHARELALYLHARQFG